MVSSGMPIFFIMLRRECLLRLRQRQEIINPLLFFILVTILFPLAITPDDKMLTLIGAGIIWAAALLAQLLSLQKIFQEDASDGSLEQQFLTPHSFTSLLSAKLIAHWLLQALPMIVVTPLLALLFHFSWHAMWVLWFSLLLGLPILSGIGVIAAALTVGLRHSELLLTILLLPLYIPTLIFATGAVLAANAGMSAAAPLAFLGAMLALVICFAPVITTAALRVGLGYE
jgi:heme exporter protein B